MSTPENLSNVRKQLEEFKAMLAQARPSSIWKYLDECQDALRKTQESLTNPKQKQILGEMLAQAADKRREFQNMVPRLLADLGKTEQEGLDWVQNFSTQTKQTEKDIQDKLQAEAEQAASFQKKPPPATPAALVDANHGAGLALEMLETLGLLKTAVTGHKGFEDAGSIARMWSETETPDHEKDAPAAAGTPPAKTDRTTLKPRPTPLRRPPREEKPTKSEPPHDESIGKMTFEDE